MIMAKYKLYMIDPVYMDTLRQTDERVPLQGNDPYHWRPFVGPVMEVDGVQWFVDFSSYKPDKEAMYDVGKLFTFKMMDRNHPGLVLSTVNLRYMIPVPKSALAKVDLNDIGMTRKFLTYGDEVKFKRLLVKQLDEANSQSKYINEAAMNLYARKIVFPDDVISKISINYRELSNVCRQWDEEHTIVKDKGLEYVNPLDIDSLFIKEDRTCTKKKQ
jgi:hypothetical protein